MSVRVKGGGGCAGGCAAACEGEGFVHLAGRCDKLTDEGLIALGKGVEGLGQLSQLHLNFRVSGVVAGSGVAE